MAHFAKLDENNVVIDVHVVHNDVIVVNGVESEQAGIDFLTNLHGYALWKQTSYNGVFRKRMAGIGYTYNLELDAFIPPKEFPSFIFDEINLLYIPPTPMPTDGKRYSWNEENQEWTEITG
jgi:lipopolysaccharide biosynthesis glycosyltransferase